MPKIISVSRRGDVAAFYALWFINRIREGFCYYQIPYGGKIHRVSLKTEDCAGIVFWTRNPYPLFEYIDELKQRGYYFYFHFTITGYPRLFESNTPLLDISIERFESLAKRIGPESAHWRYDPILLSNISTEAFHIKNFSYIAKKLKGKTRICTISFTDFYGKTQNNLSKIKEKYGIQFYESLLENKIELFRILKGIASENGIKLRSCCDDSLVKVDVSREGCVGKEYLSMVRPDFDGGFPKRPTRTGCCCRESVDIGVYETCLFGCSYCYATRNRETAIRHFQKHDPLDEILLRPSRYIGVDLSSLEES